MARYLVIAYQTAQNPALIRELRRLVAEDRDAEFVLLVPATAASHLRLTGMGESFALAKQAAAKARERFRAEGIEVSAVRVRDPNPVVAATAELAEYPDYGAVVVSTFPVGVSRWLRMDVVSRLERVANVPVYHVVAEDQSADSET